MHDLLISDATVVDGTGAPRRHAGIAVSDGRITEVGAVTGPARRTIDAKGAIVSPGFIDVHTHFDVQGFWDPTLSPSPLHGVTTVLGGNCGFTVAPLDDDAAGYLMRMLARVEGMPLESLEQGVPWDWRSTGEYLDRLDGRLAVNAGFMVGHSAVRRVVMGAAATERTATPEELDQMKALLRDGLAAGAFGFSSTWSTTHNDAEGRPVPSRWADRNELVELASVCREFEGTSLEFLPSAFGPFSEEVSEVMVAMTVAAQRPLNWNIMVVSASTLPAWLDKLEVGSRAQAAGGKVVGLVIPETLSPRLCFRSGFVLDALPGWEKPMALPLDEKLALLRDPDERHRLNELAQQPGPARPLAHWADKELVETFSAETKRYEGRIVGEIATREGKDPFDVLCDIACADELRTQFITPRRPSTRADWEARVQVFRDPRAVIGASDAGAHLDMIATFNFSTVVLEKVVREEELLPLEEAVHLITEVPARLYGLRDRGTIVEGAHADLVVFDEGTVGTGPIHTRVDLPGGAGRLYAGATGIEHVIVNGVPIVSGDEFTDDRPGTLMRSGRDSATPALN
jgi:N-acyl-D-aspartate/D-glutamate deacylase